MRPLLASLALLAGLSLHACGGGTAGPDAGGSGRADGGTGADADEIIFPGDTGTLTWPDTGGPAPSYLIYAHTGKTLLKVDPSVSPMKLETIGDFDCASMTDLAVDKNGKLYGVSSSAVYPLEIQGTTVRCGAAWPLKSGSGVLYGLTFAPAGVLGVEETLVAANSAGELWAIDTAGNATRVGTFGTVPPNDGHGHAYPAKNVGKAWELSGDIVFLSNNGSPVGFATLRDCPNPPDPSGCSTTDTLVEIDVPKLKAGSTDPVTKSIRGQVVRNASCKDTATEYGSMYGIAAWNDKVYGFSYSGAFVEIFNKDGTACQLAEYSSWKFAGAGVTTVAPVIVEPN